MTIVKIPPSTDLANLPPKQRILATAQRLFYREGIRSTGVDRIIAESGVTKVTFYRQFPSKDDLIQAFLEGRHAAWIVAFRDMLVRRREAQSPQDRRSAPLAPVHSAAQEIIYAPDFRGCAFANSVAEVGPSLPSIHAIASRHKQEVCEAIATLLPAQGDAAAIAWAATLALDGAIVNARADRASADSSLRGLRTLLDALSATLTD